MYRQVRVFIILVTVGLLHSHLGYAQPNDASIQALEDYLEDYQRKRELACKKKGVFEKYYQECILEKMPGARNVVAINEASNYCRNKAPCSIVKNKKSGIIGVSSAHECFEKYGSRHPIQRAAAQIRSACYELYVE